MILYFLYPSVHLLLSLSLSLTQIITVSFSTNDIRLSFPVRTVTTVRITIIDTNDHSPLFPRKKFEFYVSEDTPANAIIGKVKALDFDTDKFAQTR